MSLKATIRSARSFRAVLADVEDVIIDQSVLDSEGMNDKLLGLRAQART
jgi:hypothetical protein